VAATIPMFPRTAAAFLGNLCSGFRRVAVTPAMQDSEFLHPCVQLLIERRLLRCRFAGFATSNLALGNQLVTQNCVPALTRLRFGNHVEKAAALTLKHFDSSSDASVYAVDAVSFSDVVFDEALDMFHLSWTRRFRCWLDAPVTDGCSTYCASISATWPRYLTLHSTTGFTEMNRTEATALRFSWRFLRMYGARHICLRN